MYSVSSAGVKVPVLSASREEKNDDEEEDDLIPSDIVGGPSRGVGVGEKK